jgi:hypothetical protein
MGGYLRNAAWVLLTVVVSFWVGALFAAIFPGLNEKPLKLLIDTCVAVGTIGAVIVALQQMSMQREENQSRVCLEEGRRMLELAVKDFLQQRDPEGRPKGTRRHWLNFARGISIAQSFGNRITNADMRWTWEQTEHYWREKMYDVLNPTLESFPADYYGPMDDKEFYKNFGWGPGDREPVSERSAAFVYRWVKWPKGRPDPLDGTPNFSEDEKANMELFGPRGLGRYITKFYNPPKPPKFD